MRPSTNPIVFYATSRTGLGHLRRLTNIAAAASARQPARPLVLATNARVDGLTAAEMALYSRCITVEKNAAARVLEAMHPAAVVVDTARVPDIERIRAPLLLLLRETLTHLLPRFALPGRRWDRIIVPNPGKHWRPADLMALACEVRNTGWIYRDAPADTPAQEVGGIPRVLIASGGGGATTSWAPVATRLNGLFTQVRQRLSLPFRIEQALGPRVTDQGMLRVADTRFAPGPELHRLFGQYTLVVSTAGYNSSLELARSDVPTLLAGIRCTYDDQAARARHFGARLGRSLNDSADSELVPWICRVLASRCRRPRLHLDESGADAAARAILELAR
ncbi:MAG: hypothetical protein H6993_11515 [Pseudomonadales bacterium]|nr:hypothetical protein [Pseudomonadales bacterium]MCP5184583.1 hypothetical protein [Pseudomonadales bacterium]